MLSNARPGASSFATSETAPSETERSVLDEVLRVGPVERCVGNRVRLRGVMPEQVELAVDQREPAKLGFASAPLADRVPVGVEPAGLQTARAPRVNATQPEPLEQL